MNRETFLQDISSMNRDDINKYFEKQHIRTKKITPLIILGKDEKNKGGDINGRETK